MVMSKKTLGLSIGSCQGDAAIVGNNGMLPCLYGVHNHFSLHTMCYLPCKQCGSREMISI